MDDDDINPSSITTETEALVSGGGNVSDVTLNPAGMVLCNSRASIPDSNAVNFPNCLAASKASSGVFTTFMVCDPSPF